MVSLRKDGCLSEKYAARWIGRRVRMVCDGFLPDTTRHDWASYACWFSTAPDAAAKRNWVAAPPQGTIGTVVAVCEVMKGKYDFLVRWDNGLEQFFDFHQYIAGMEPVDNAAARA